MQTNIRVGLIDDHVLLRRGLAGLLTERGFEIVIEASNGKTFIDALQHDRLPDVVLTDISMPVMNGYAVAEWLHTHHPDIGVIALSMIDDDIAIIRMLHRGVKGYIMKDCLPEELVEAIKCVHEKGYYQSELMRATLLRSVQPFNRATDLSKKEIEFLQHSCSEMTYKEIATLMKLSPRTIDGYRDSLFEKLKVRSRIGLVLYAIQHKLFHV